jgi:hypothetical protein
MRHGYARRCQRKRNRFLVYKLMRFVDDFMNKYYFNLPKFRTYEDAYNATEAEYLERYGVPRYKNYDVFRSALSRWLAQGRNK